MSPQLFWNFSSGLLLWQRRGLVVRAGTSRTRVGDRPAFSCILSNVALVPTELLPRSGHRRLLRLLRTRSLLAPTGRLPHQHAFGLVLLLKRLSCAVAEPRVSFGTLSLEEPV